MVRPKKHLGQHFLRDENIAMKIIASMSGKYKNVLEIGPGTGVLTKYLLRDTSLNSFFFEVDRESIAFLKNTYPEMEGRLSEADFLSADLSAIPVPFCVIGNFPYNISSQILFRILESRKDVPEVVGMFQKEVAERIASPPGSKKYGILSVLIQAFYQVEYLFTVSETVFFPPPKVKSAVIRLILTRDAIPGLDEKLFFKVVKTAFNQRRKTLRNALKSIRFAEQERVQLLFTQRAEQLTVEDFLFLTGAVLP
jgi:16S rRNA (adenine1518-N6/adenine1519-N6)-dimethyltransferase